MTVTSTTARRPRPGPVAGMWRHQPWITTIARLGLAAVLAYAGWKKATQPVPLQKLAVEAYRLIPADLVETVAIGLPILELVLALLLAVGFATRMTAVLAGGLLLVFIAGVASAWARGLSIDCGCFGGGGVVAQDQTRYVQEILRDVGFLLAAAWITVRPRSRFAVDRLLDRYVG